jgi:5,6,7,8-tetrahydromethanopterin hydro-lyase
MLGLAGHAGFTAAAEVWPVVATGQHGILSPRLDDNPILERKISMSMFIGEALVGEGNEVAHIDLLIGSKDGPVGAAFANALARQSEGHSNLLAVLAPNLAVKPATVMITKVTIKGAKQAVQMFGPAQAAVAKAVADSVAAGVIPKSDCENLVIVCGVFIHWLAEDDKKIYEFNYKATMDAIANAMKGSPSADEMIAGKDKAEHPFKGF